MFKKLFALLRVAVSAHKGKIFAAAAIVAVLFSVISSSTVAAGPLSDFVRAIPATVSGLSTTIQGGISASLFSPTPTQTKRDVVDGDPSVTSDKLVYEPGETATFTGANWMPGESVTIVLREATADAGGVEVTATADDAGSFSITVAVPASDPDGTTAANSAPREVNEREEKERKARTSKPVGKRSASSISSATSQSSASATDGTLFNVVARGSSSGSSAQSQFKVVINDGDSDDADLPAFMIGRVNKEDYFNRRDEFVNRLRGIEKGRPFDPGARGKAIRDMNRKQGIADGSVSTSNDEGSVSGIPASISGPNFGSGPQWVSIGPAPIPNGQTFGVSSPVSGRVTAIAVNPTNSDIVYAAGAQGGVYRTLNGGASWTPIFDNAQTLSVGAIAIAPSQPSTIYVGTGEGNFSCDSYFGVGVYRIDNADGPNPTLSGPFATDGTNDVLTGRSISKVLVHPTNPNIIFIGVTNGIGGIGCDAGLSTSGRGLYRSTNATSSNATFQKIALNTANGGNRSVTDMEFEPGNPNTMLATVVGFNSAGDGGVYRSTNALDPVPTFTRTLVTGTASATARVELAINKVGDAVTVFAGISDSSGTVKRSVDGGVTWSAALANATGYCGGQCTYDMPIAVDSTNANILYIGGNADGTSSAILKKSTNALSATPTFTKIQTGLHADSHSIEIDPSNPNTVWFGNDGGIWRSSNGGGLWTSMNTSGFNATQFQSLALHPTDPNYLIGGTQDNGTERQRPDGTWTRTDYGDGGFALIDQSAANTTTVRQYHTYFNQTNNLIAFATTTSSAAFENWSALGCGATANGISCTDSVLFYAPMALGPGTPNTLYFGTNKLYRSTNSGTTMTVISQAFTGPVSAIGISPQSDNVRIVGLNSGKVYRTVTGANPMNDVTGSIPARYVSRAVIDPNNQNTAYVTLATYFGSATAHIYKTTNLGDAAPTWTALDGGQIPDVPINAFAVDPADSNMLYAGTDIGVYRSMDGGTTWEPFSNGLPRVAVFDMAVHNASRKLRIATHGRGIWEISVAASPAVIQGTVTSAASTEPIQGATVTAGNSTTTTDENGFYQFSTIPAGTYSLTVSAIGYTNGTAANVAATNGSTTTQNFALVSAAADACNTDTTQADFKAGLPSNVDTSLSPGDVTLAPADLVSVSQTSLAFFVDSINTTNWQAQTFTPTVTGKLTQTDFQAAISSGGTLGTVVVEIRDVVSGVPGTTVLGSANVTSIASTTNAWYSVSFPTPINVAAGTQYALVLRAASGGNYRAVRSSTSTYAGGAWLSSTTSGTSWTTNTTDLAFVAYVVPQIYNTPSGYFVSSPKDANQADGTAAAWTTISWNAATPAGTEVKLQAAASNDANGVFSFVGPDGTSGTYFNSGDSLAQFNGKRYLKYKAYLSTTNTTVTPALNDVTICNSNTPLPATTLAVDSATGPYGGTATLSATLTSGGSPVAGKSVVFKVNGANFAGNTVNTDSNGVAAIPSFSLSGLNAGTYTNYVTAKFASDSAYAGSNGSADLTVEKATPTVQWSNPAGITYGTLLSGTQLNATASVPGSFVYTPGAGTKLPAGSGQTLSVKFTPTDSVNYNEVLKDVSIDVAKAGQTITFSTLANKVYGDPDFNVSASSDSSLVVSFSVGVTDNCTISGSTVHLTGAGTCTVTASQPGDDNYNAATSVSRTFSIAPASQTISFGTLAGKTYGDADFAISATATSGLTVSFGAAGSCSIVAGPKVHITGAGSCTVTASQGGDANYHPAPSVQQSFNIAKASLTVTADSFVKQYSDPMPVLTVQYAGFVPNETQLVLGGTLSISTLANALSPAGMYDITPGGLTSSNYSITFVKGKLTVSQEGASLTYTGDTLVSPSKAGGNATVNFAAVVQEEADGNLGNTLVGKTVRFSIFKSNNSTMTNADYVVNGTVALVNGVSVAKASMALTADNYAVKIELVANNEYAAPVEQAVVTVVDPGTGIVTGGGTLVEADGSRGNFGFTMKYNSSGKPQGNNLYISRLRTDLSAYGAPSGVRDYNLIFKSNALSAMMSNPTASPKTATFTGRNNIKAVDRLTGVTYDITGGVNFNFQVDVTDRGEPSGSANADSYAFRVWTSTGDFKVIGTYNSNGTNATQVTLSGGNIQVK